MGCATSSGPKAEIAFNNGMENPSHHNPSETQPRSIMKVRKYPTLLAHKLTGTKTDSMDMHGSDSTTCSSVGKQKSVRINPTPETRMYRVLKVVLRSRSLD